MQSGFLSLAFLSASRNSRERSIDSFMEMIVVPLGSLTSLRIVPYSTDHDTFLPSSKSRKSSDLRMRSSSNVMVGSSMTSFALLWQKTGFFSKRLALAFSTVFASKAASSGLLGTGSAAGIVAGGMVTAAGCGAGVCSAWGAAGDVGGCSTWGVVVSGAGAACRCTWNGLASGAAAPLDVPVPKISLMSRPSSALIS